MIVLYLLAAHLVGDFVLQTRWQAAGKFGDEIAAVNLRARHVTVYCLLFVPISVAYSRSALYATAFMVILWVLHFFTDRQRFTSTLGDLVGWKFGGRDAYMKRRLVPTDHGPRPPASPWGPLPIVIDQTLHVCQIALLAGWLL